MSKPTNSSPQTQRLAIAEDREGPFQAAPWIGPLVALGSRVSRYVDEHPERQLVVVISLPRRDFGAVLVGCGWVMASKAPVLASPIELLRSAEPGVAIRAVNEQYVVSGTFGSLDELATPPRANFAGSGWQVDKIKALALVDGPVPSSRSTRPEVGSVGRLARLDTHWEARLARPAADLAIVGTMTWLKEDLAAFVSREEDLADPTAIVDLLLPDASKLATWFTRMYAASGFADELPLPADVDGVILDGAGAIKYLGDVEAAAIICILDRSIADETAAETVVQIRNSRGEPISISEDLRWRAPAGVEALAYTVAL